MHSATRIVWRILLVVLVVATIAGAGTRQPVPAETEKRLKALDAALEAGILTREEYDRERAALLPAEPPAAEKEWPGSPEAERAYKRGEGLLKQGKAVEAEAAFRQALALCRLDESRAACHSGIGAALLGQRKLAEATAAAREAIRLDASKGDYHAVLGMTLHVQKQYSDAVASLREGIRLGCKTAADKAAAHFLLALALDALGQEKLPEATAAAQEAVRIDESNGQYHLHLGNLLLKQKKYVDARAAYLRAAKLLPYELALREMIRNGDLMIARVVDHLVDKGVSLAEQEKHVEAEAAFREAIRTHPDRAVTMGGRLLLGDALFAQDKFAEAAAAYRQAIEAGETKAHYSRRYRHCDLARALWKLGEKQSALVEIRKQCEQDADEWADERDDDGELVPVYVGTDLTDLVKDALSGDADERAKLEKRHPLFREPGVLDLLNEGLELVVPDMHKTIGAAIKQAWPGDTVVVKPGTYREIIVLKDGVTLKGTDVDRCIIEAPDKPEKIGDDTAEAILTARNCKKGTVTKLTFDGRGVKWSKSLPCGVILLSSSVSMSACKVRAFAGDGVRVSGEAPAPTLKDNECSGNGGWGILFWKGARGVADGNRIGRNEIGVFVTDEGTSVKLLNNVLEGNRSGGIAVTDGASCVAERNRCNRNGNTGISVADQGTEVTLRANHCEESGTGINLSKGASGTISDCVCRRNDFGVFIMGAGTRANLDGNRAEHNKEVGITYTKGARGVADQNTCLGNGTGIAVLKEGTTATLRGNRCEANSFGIFYRDASGGVIEQNTSSKNKQYGIMVYGKGSAPTLRANACHDNKTYGIIWHPDSLAKIAPDNKATGNGQGQIVERRFEFKK